MKSAKADAISRNSYAKENAAMLKSVGRALVEFSDESGRRTPREPLVVTRRLGAHSGFGFFMPHGNAAHAYLRLREMSAIKMKTLPVF